MRITQEADYAIRIVCRLAQSEERRVSAAEVSDSSAVSVRFTLKILHKLVQGDLVQSFKGVNGGYKLKKAPKDITLKQVIELIDGPIAIARCLDSGESCSLNCDKSACDYHHIFDIISIDLANKLNRITIDDVINKNYYLT